MFVPMHDLFTFLDFNLRGVYVRMKFLTDTSWKNIIEYT